MAVAIAFILVSICIFGACAYFEKKMREPFKVEKKKEFYDDTH